MAQEKAVIRDSCLVFRENLLAGLWVALVGIPGGSEVFYQMVDYVGTRDLQFDSAF